LAKKTSLHKRGFEEKKMPLIGWNKDSGRVDDSPLGRENVRVSLFLLEVFTLKKRRVLTVHGG